MTWILIFWLTSPEPHPVVIPGFALESECEDAGRRIAQTSPGGVRWTCVVQRHTR